MTFFLRSSLISLCSTIDWTTAPRWREKLQTSWMALFLTSGLLLPRP